MFTSMSRSAPKACGRSQQTAPEKGAVWSINNEDEERRTKNVTVTDEIWLSIFLVGDGLSISVIRHTTPRVFNFHVQDVPSKRFIAF